MSRQPSDLFTGTAHYYARFRAGYPDAFFQHVVDRFGLDGKGRLLDLGCGTGQLTIPLAHYASEAVGMDPDPDMLAEAAAAAERTGVRNVRWVHGGVVLVGEPERIWSGSAPWHAAVRGVIQRWLGPQRRAGSRAYAITHAPFDVILARSPFPRIEAYDLTYRRESTVDEIIGYLYSTSYCSPTVLGDRREPFEDDLRRTLRELNPSGIFAEEVEVGGFLAWRGD